MKDTRYSLIATRSVLVLFWIVTLFGFLFLPLFSRWLLPERSLTIFTWPTTLDIQYLRKFEKQTGIKLYVSYYESNQELFSKLRMTKGEGYDLIMPSDYTIELLIKENLLKKIDKSKLTFLDRLDPRLLNLYYDPSSSYSLPFFWGTYGLGINKDYFGAEQPPATWGLIFDKSLAPSAIGMTDEPREAIMLAAQYLFGSIDVLKDRSKIEQIKKLLFQQKEWVYVYTESRSEDLLLSRSCPVIVALSADISKIIKNHDHIGFIMPKEGIFGFIDAFVIPKTTNKDDMIYQFINFLYQPEVVLHHVKKYGFCSPVTDIQNDEVGSICPNDAQFKKLDFFRNIVPEELLNEIWIELMAR